MRRAVVLLLLLLASCQAEQQEAAPKPEPVSAGILVDYGDYTFEEPTSETAENLESFIQESVPSRFEVVDTTVRSVHDDGKPAGAEIIAAALDRGQLDLRKFYIQILGAIAPGRGRTIADGNAVLVKAEGTSAVATFPKEEVLLYMVGKDDDLLEELTVSLLRLNAP